MSRNWRSQPQDWLDAARLPWLCHQLWPQLPREPSKTSMCSMCSICACGLWPMALAPGVPRAMLARLAPRAPPRPHLLGTGARCLSLALLSRRARRVDHYALLGLRRFTGDVKEIGAAYEGARQMAQELGSDAPWRRWFGRCGSRDAPVTGSEKVLEIVPRAQVAQLEEAYEVLSSQASSHRPLRLRHRS